MPTILIVEDEAANRDMLGRRLERYGYTIIFAVDGPSGVQAAREHVPDVILMDIVMREMDGFTATRMIKADQRTRHIPIIALTAGVDAHHWTTSLEAGCTEFETKPVELVRLLKKIDSCLTRTVSAASDQ